LPTYSRVFDDAPQWSERRYVEAVADVTDIEPHYIVQGGFPPFNDLSRTLADQDGPYLAPALELTEAIYSAAVADGHRVILSGHGGDEVVSLGLGRLAELAMARRWRTLWGESRALPYGGAFSRASTVFAYFRLFGPLRKTFARLHARKERSELWRDLIDPDLARRTDAAALRAEALSPFARARTHAQSHLAGLEGRLQSYALEVLDKVAASAGIEARYPFWDKRLVDFCLSLDPEEVLKDGVSRRILRRALADVMPPLVRNRTDKLDFSPHLALGMTGARRQMIDDLLLDDSAAIGAYVRRDRVRSAWRRVTEAGAQARGEDVQAVWRCVVLAGWLQEREAAPPGPSFA
jgi:asparagine synthase (glutamine-hydrolysing)